MHFFGGLGLVLLTMVAYSIGRVLPGKKFHITPGLYDGVIIIALWVLALTVSFLEGWLAYLFWISIAIGIGVVITLFVRSSLPPAILDLEVNLRNTRFFNKIWSLWKAFAFRMGNFQGRLILLLFYFSILLPFGLINTLFRNPLNLRKPAEDSFWFPIAGDNKDIHEARRQF